MPQMQIEQAREIVGRVAESPDGAQELSTRQIAQAIATVLVRNALLAPRDG